MTSGGQMRWMALMMVVACSGDSSTGTPTDTGATGDTPTNTYTNTNTQTTHGADNAFLEATVLDSAGAPMSAVNLRLCRPVGCRNGITDANGTFTFGPVEAEWHSYEIEGHPLATVLAPLEFAVDQTRSLTLKVPALDPASPLGASAEVEVGEGLFVTVGASDLDTPVLQDPATEIAGVRVADADFPPVDGATEVLAVWYMEPFNYWANNGGLPVRIANLWSLKDGDTYAVWVGSYDDTSWLEAGTLTVEGEYLTGTAKLPLISTVALVAIP